jgi:hypothetical protein
VRDLWRPLSGYVVAGALRFIADPPVDVTKHLSYTCGSNMKYNEKKKKKKKAQKKENYCGAKE